jgi:organic radical activating enzyme
MTNLYTELTPEELASHIKGHKRRTYLWTGGEPTLQIDEILETMNLIWGSHNFIETNGTNLDPRLQEFDFVTFSPKHKCVAESVRAFGVTRLTGLRSSGYSTPTQKYEIKIVTDLQEVGLDMIQYATCLMPLTTGDADRDLEIKKHVWEYCANHGIRYSPRAHLGVE